jgi:hypothetical protein
MKSIHSGEECARVLDQLDFYRDRELAADVSGEIAKHVAECASCTRELEARDAMRTRLRTAVRDVAPTPGLDTRIRHSIAEASAPAPRVNWLRPAMALAALVVAAIGLSVAYQLGHLRLTSASQEAFYRSVSQQASVMTNVALGDHLHCAFFRKYSKNPPPPEQMVEDMGPQYKDLIALVKSHIPAGYRVEQAHRCTYKKRPFVHVIAKNGSRIVSLIIAEKRDGETFARETASAVVSQMPVYQAKVRQFEFAGFETSRHLVYVVSDLDAHSNMEFMTAFAPGVLDVLRRVESGV